MVEKRAARGWLRGLVTAAVVALLYLATVEAALRFLPVATGLRSVAVNAQRPIFHYEPNRNFVYSVGWRMRQVNHGRINNAGWVNDQDYHRDAPLPLIAVIGDSYIEAEMVPYRETVQGRLAAALNGRYRVYSVAASGAPLSEFLVYAKYAVRDLGAEAVIFNIANYNFAGSDAAFAQPLGMWVYGDGGGDGKLLLIPYQPGALRRIVRHSALLRYLALNLRLDRQLFAATRVASASPIAEAFAAPASSQDARAGAAEKVIRNFFRDLPEATGLPSERVSFVMDGFRYPEVAAAEAGSPADRLRQHFRVAADADGYAVIDLDPLFFERYLQSGTRFEVPGDRHWNGTGHAVAADGVLSSRFLAKLGDAAR